MRDEYKEIEQASAGKGILEDMTLLTTNRNKAPIDCPNINSIGYKLPILNTNNHILEKYYENNDVNIKCSKSKLDKPIIDNSINLAEITNNIQPSDI